MSTASNSSTVAAIIEQPVKISKKEDGKPNSKKSSSKATSKQIRKSSSNQLLNPSYKFRYDEFKQLFGELIEENEKLIIDYSCALCKTVVIHGRVYLSLSHICFYASIFDWKSTVVIKFKEIASINKASSEVDLPNAITITTKVGDKYTLASFVAQDKAYKMMLKLWKDALLEEIMSSTEFFQHLHDGYGEDLGFTSEEEVKYAQQISRQHDLENDSNLNNVPDLARNNSSENKMDPISSSENEEIYLTDTKESQNVTELDSPYNDKTLDLIPVSCIHSNHDGIELANQYLPLDVDVAFRLIFSDCKFFRSFFTRRKATNLIITEWCDFNQSKQEEMKDFKKMRKLTFNLKINHAFADTVKTQEYQYLSSQSSKGSLYMVRSEVTNTGIPLSNNFLIVTQYCLTRGRNEKECSLVIHQQVVFKKYTYGMKSMIENASLQKGKEYGNDLVSCLLEWAQASPEDKSEKLENFSDSVCDALDPTTSTSPSSDFLNTVQPSTSTCRKRKKAVDKCINEAFSTFANITELNKSNLNSVQTDQLSEISLLRLILILLLFLFVVNFFLYYRLWKLEEATREFDKLLFLTYDQTKSSINSNDQTISFSENIMN